jgi:DNA-binding GntR family transcriptional regulator
LYTIVQTTARLQEPQWRKSVPEIETARGKRLPRQAKEGVLPAMMIEDLSDRDTARQPGANSAQGPLSQIAYDSIFEAIQNGKLKPGSRVRENELTDWLEMSRTPIRDALRRLEGQGLLRHESYRGVVISSLDRQMVGELYTAREWAEGAAAALAARHASDAEIATLRALLKLERDAADDPALGARFNRKLHLALYASTHNRYLINQLTSLAALLALAGNTTRRSPTRVAEAHREHKALVDAIAAHDADAAEKLARRHIQAAQRVVLTNWIEEEMS